MGKERRSYVRTHTWMIKRRNSFQLGKPKIQYPGLFPVIHVGNGILRDVDENGNKQLTFDIRNINIQPVEFSHCYRSLFDLFVSDNAIAAYLLIEEARSGRISK